MAKYTDAGMVARKYYQSADNINDMRPAYSEMGKAFRARARRVFATKTGWEQLKDSTMDIRHMRGGNPNRQSILNDSGVLRKSWVQRKKRGNVHIESKSGLLLGSRIRYAYFQETGVARTGGMIPGKRIPARKIQGNPSFGGPAPAGYKTYAEIARDHMLRPWKPESRLKAPEPK